ncbi:hypothetical protein Q7P35_007960 [Cladosporium inversicolor]
MPSYNVVGLIALSILVAFGGALPSPPLKGPPHGPPHSPHGPGSHDGPIFSRPTGINGGPIFPTGPFPTDIIPSGTATNGLPVLPAPTFDAEEFDVVKRFEGPRGKGPNKPWHQYKPRPTNPSRPSDAPQPPPFATGRPVPSGTQGTPVGFPTGGPFPPGPTSL